MFYPDASFKGGTNVKLFGKISALALVLGESKLVGLLEMRTALAAGAFSLGFFALKFRQEKLKPQ